MIFKQNKAFFNISNFYLYISLAHERNTMAKYRCTHIDQCNTWNGFKQHHNHQMKQSRLSSINH